MILPLVCVKWKKMTTEEKYNLLLGHLKKLRAEYGFETAENGPAILKRAIKGWGSFCGFFGAFIETKEQEK